MDLHIDTSRCQGHGRCYALAPEIFAADDEGFGTVRSHTATGGRSEAELAADNCPEFAIHITQA
ncbi:hypothetical protein AXA44_21825 [Rhodococcus sp. SC4]|nr:hypothetical protein AXA44_21825 [Rhodococcus sp. SC4]